MVKCFGSGWFFNKPSRLIRRVTTETTPNFYKKRGTGLKRSLVANSTPNEVQAVQHFG